MAVGPGASVFPTSYAGLLRVTGGNAAVVG